MIRLVAVMSIHLMLVSFAVAAGAKDKEMDVINEYEQYFSALFPEEQVLEFTSRFTNFYLQSGPYEFSIAKDHFRKVSGLEAMPYLKREF